MVQGDGITISSCNNITVRNFDIKAFSVGIASYGGSTEQAKMIKIINNSISNCNLGIDFWGDSNNYVSENGIRGNEIGITIKGTYTQTYNVFEYVSFNTIERNTITNNIDGLRIESARNNTFQA